MYEVSVIIPANNEETYIGPCLEALYAQVTARQIQVIVSANACSDDTVSIARSYTGRFAERGWQLEVLDSEISGKPAALNRADDVASGGTRIYLDADVVMSSRLLDGLAKVLDRPDPAYASGDLKVSPARSWVTRAYGRIWTRLPFMTQGVPGAGLFAVNTAGRTRWGAFPEIISDDTFVRLQFTPDERLPVNEPYYWPLVEGFPALVRVRRRQDAGVAELARLYPGLPDREGKAPLTIGQLVRIALTDPIGFTIYLAVSLSVRARKDTAWSRGR